MDSQETKKYLRLTAFAEGVSFLALLFISMPLKYIWEIKAPNMIIGMAHGLLFILYVVFVFLARSDFKWTIKTTVIALLASVVPCGTFYVDKTIFKKMGE